jgi:DNA (cytosine-5)-methyltransferase 1
MEKFTAIDLFCGAGGLTVGLKKAGFNVLAGVEMNPAAAETYLLNHKSHKVYKKDIKELDPFKIMQDLKLEPGNLDLLAGCPPCQGFSSHRTRNKTTSIDDDRNDLVFEFVKYVKAFLPKTIMMENVPALAKDRRITKVLKDLKDLGYFINDHSLVVKDAADYGVPQRRKRMILKVSRYGVLEETEPVKKRKTVSDAIKHLPPAGKSGDPLHDYEEKRSDKIKELISKVPKNGGSRSQLPYEYWLPCHKKNPNTYRDVYGRMKWESVAPTITGGCCNPSKGRFLHPDADRAITLREAALLQTFPAKYKFSSTVNKEKISLMIGNALPPEFIRMHALTFYKHLAALKDNKNGQF